MLVAVLPEAAPAREGDAALVAAALAHLAAAQRVGDARLGGPHRRVHLAVGAPVLARVALGLALLPVDPPEADMLILDQIAQDNIFHGICMHGFKSVRRGLRFTPQASINVQVTVALTRFIGTVLSVILFIAPPLPVNSVSLSNIASQLLTPEASCRLSVTKRPFALR